MYQVNFPKGISFKKARILTWVLLAATGVLIAGCSFVGAEGTVVIKPHEGAPVTVIKRNAELFPRG